MSAEDASAVTRDRLVALVRRLRAEIDRVRAQANSQSLLDIARGILVERLRCGPTQAAQQLATLADAVGTSELEFAADIINQTAGDRLADVTSETSMGNSSDNSSHASADLTTAVRLRTAECGILAADDVQAVAESLLEQGAAPLGATAVAIWTVAADSSLTLAGHAGFEVGEAGRWRYLPPDVDIPARRALVEHRAVWFECLSDAGLTSIGHRAAPRGGRVVVPVSTGERVVGILEICWPCPLEAQSPRIQRQIEALAQLCAHVLKHSTKASAGRAVRTPPESVVELAKLADGLHDPALVLNPVVDELGNLADFRIEHANGHYVELAGAARGVMAGARLLEIYPMAVVEHGLFDKIKRVHVTGEPYRTYETSSAATTDPVPTSPGPGISITRHGELLLVIWQAMEDTSRLVKLLLHAQRLGRFGGFEESNKGEVIWNRQLFGLFGLPPTANPVPLEQLAAHAHPDDTDAICRFLRTVLHHRRAASTAFRLQRPDGIIRHVRVTAEPLLDNDQRLQAVRGAYQDVSTQHWTEVALSATRDQLVHTEQQAVERNRLALQLQHIIMPPCPTPIDAFGLHIAVRYRPAEQGHVVGGDWYDAIVLPSKQILLSIGDIAGHGVEAATDMVLLRNALRGLAVTGVGPTQLLSWLNKVARHLVGQVFGTAICALYDPHTRILRWARAGHLPPILIRDNHASALSLISGVMLGAVAEADYEEAQIQLNTNDILLMYTDGLIERRASSLEASLRQLLSTAESPATTIEQRLDYLLTHSDADTDDDTCIIGIQALAEES